MASQTFGSSPYNLSLVEHWGVRGSRPWTPCAEGENPEAAAPWIADVGGNSQFGLPWRRRGVSLGSGWVNIPSWTVLYSVSLCISHRGKPDKLDGDAAPG